MLSMVDCIAFSGLTTDQLDAVACYKHIPVIVAAEWAETTLDNAQGVEEVEDALASEVRVATAHHLACADAWGKALDEFRVSHPSVA